MPKAILVTKNQYEKLSDSKNTQEALANFKQKKKSIDKNNYTQKQEDIEKMLEEANALYKEGKTEEAQVLYDKISQLNKELKAAKEND